MLENSYKNETVSIPTWRFIYNLDLVQRDCPVTDATLHLTIRGVPDVEEDVDNWQQPNILNARRRRHHAHQKTDDLPRNSKNEYNKLHIGVGTFFYNIYEAPISTEAYDIEIPITELIQLWASSPRHWKSGHQLVFTSPLLPMSSIPVAVVEQNSTQTQEGPYIVIKYSQTNCRRSAQSARPRRGVPTMSPNNLGRLSTNGAASFSSPFSSNIDDSQLPPSPDCTADVNRVAGHTMCCRKEITIDFHALGHKSVLTPRVLKGHVCVGRCLMPFVRSQNRGDFQEAIVK